MPKNINNSLSASEGYNHLRSMKSEVRGATTKPLPSMMIATVIGLTGNLAWAQPKCPVPNFESGKYNNLFQYGEYDQGSLLDLLACLDVKPENRCSGDNKNENSCTAGGCETYSRSMYPRLDRAKWSEKIEEEMGGNICPYSMRRYKKVENKPPTEVEIEHIVALSEAHDSGLCKREKDRTGFGNDLMNLTMANEVVNGNYYAVKGNKRIKSKYNRDFFEWNLHKDIPPGSELFPGTKKDNRCWFASRVVQIRVKWGLTIDAQERNALKAALGICGGPNDFKLKSPPSNAGSCKVVP